MKRIETTNLATIATTRNSVTTRLCVALLTACAVFSITARAQDASLDETSAGAFIQAVTPDMRTAVGDTASVSTITKRWHLRNLTGKTKAQAIDILVADVRAVVVDDPTVATALRAKWIARFRPIAPPPIKPAGPTAPADPDPSTVVLDRASAAAYTQQLAVDLNVAVGDQESVTAIKTKWAARNLVGKTKPQAIDILVADVRAVVVDDPTIASGLRTKWLAKLKPAPSRVAPSAARPSIDASKSPLSSYDLNQVMNWIAAGVTAEKLSYCYKDGTIRGNGEPLSSSCPDGLQKDGSLCYRKCKAGYDGVGPVCYGSCPEGFQDIGGFCQKPAPYGRGGGYAAWDQPKCEKENGQGCEQNGAMFYPKCKASFHAVGANICSPDCPSGYADTGTGCTKPSYGRTAGEPLACPPGLERSGLLCYPACPKGTTGLGPGCNQNCPSQYPFECGLGCATGKAECADDIKEKTLTVVEAAVNLVALGVTAGGSEVLEPFEAAKSAVEAAEATTTVDRTLLDLVDQATSTFSDNFAEMTSAEINKKIDESFSKGAATYIKKEWAKRHLAMTLGANTLAAAKKIASLIAIFDPTGLVAVANAFANPTCGADVPFPQVKPLY